MCEKQNKLLKIGNVKIISKVNQVIKKKEKESCNTKKQVCVNLLSTGLVQNRT